VSELNELSVAELSELIDRREVSPVDVTEACLRRIESTNSSINAFVTVQADIARKEARAAEAEIVAGRRVGPLHGIPVAHKDLYRTKGLRTTAGSRVHEDHVPAEDATTVARLRAAGMVLLGKLNTQEFAYGPTNEDSLFGPVRNPWNRACHPGGSSGGSGAALALDMCPATTGTDTGGSIRIPASCCGVTGLKPTYGRTSRAGVYPLCWTMDHSGPMARSARDIALLLKAMAGRDLADPTTADRVVPDYAAALDGNLNGLRVGVPSRYFYDRTLPEIEASARAALKVLEDLGAELVEFDVADIEHAATAAAVTYYVEATAYHDDEFVGGRSGLFTDRVRRFLELGNFITARDYLQSQRYRTLLGRNLAAQLRQVDLIVTPTLPITATPLGQSTIDIRGVEQPVYLALLRNTEPFNLTGLPALTVPCGISAAGLPIGLQIVGRPFEEAAVLQAGDAFQRVTDWHLRRPAAA
jgi:aspartyl-tRNA(Asn)/glutamyl-tRNA(Gln) amidotransferase subunit A